MWLRALCTSADQTLVPPVSHPENKGRQVWPPLAMAPWFLAMACAKLWPVLSRALVVQERCSQRDPCPAPLGRGVCKPGPQPAWRGHGLTPARCPGMAWLRKVVALAMLYITCLNFSPLPAQVPFPTPP